uniref:Uncharacterized protein n=1 Tax=Anopheles coluzzii TaxID=1518534 RepID=A0A8W7P9B0_ANOCL
MMFRGKECSAIGVELVQTSRPGNEDLLETNSTNINAPPSFLTPKWPFDILAPAKRLLRPWTTRRKRRMATRTEEEADGEEQQVGSSSGSTLFLSSSSCNDSGCTLPTQSLPAIVARQEDTTGDSTEELRPDDPSWPSSTGGGSVVAAADESLRASAFVPTTMVDAASVPPLHGWYPPYFRSFELVRRWRSMLFESSISDLIPPRIPLGPLGSTTPDPASAPGARLSRFKSRELVREWPFPYFDSSSSFRSLECFMLFSFAPDIPPQPATAPMLLFFSTATSCEKELFRDEPPPVTRAPVELRNFTATAAAAAVAELHVLRATARARLQMVQDVAYVASAARRQRGRLLTGTVVVLLQRDPPPEMTGRGRLLLCCCCC